MAEYFLSKFIENVYSYKYWLNNYGQEISIRLGKWLPRNLYNISTVREIESRDAQRKTIIPLYPLH